MTVDFNNHITLQWQSLTSTASHHRPASDLFIFPLSLPPPALFSTICLSFGPITGHAGDTRKRLRVVDYLPAA